MAYSGGYASGYADGVAPAVAFAATGGFAATADVSVVFAGTGTFTAGPTVDGNVAYAGAGTFTATAGVSFTATVRFPGGSTFTVVAVAGAAAAFVGRGSFGAGPAGVAVTGSTTSGSAAVTSATPVFTAGDVGRPISGAGIPDGAVIVAVGSPTAATISVPATATATGATLTLGQLAYRVDVVDVNGSLFGTLINARVGRYSWELNAAGTADFTLATTDPDAYLVRPGREVQIWRNGSLVWWGPIVRPQAGLRETTWQCASLLWYFERRFMGRADRTNLLTNGNFEAGETNWTFAGGVTHAVDTTLKVEGTKSLRLAGVTADHTGYAHQTIPAWTQYHPDGDYLTVSTWVFVPSGDYLGGAIGDLGLVAIHRNSAGATVDAQFVTIDDATIKNKWVPLEVGIAAVKTGDTIQVKLYPPHGTAYFDLVTLTAMESLSFWPTADVATVVAGIVNYAQDRGVFTHRKSDLNIGVAAAATGTSVDRTYQFAEHPNVADSLLEFVRMGIIDVDIVISPSTRTFTTYAPSKGSLFGTLLELDVNVADFTWSWDGENAASTVVILGPGDGPDRPEGVATDTAFLDGLSLEMVEQAPDDATVGELDAVAAERLEVAATPEILEVTTLPGVGIIGNLTVGDTAPVRIHHGWIHIDTVWRVARIEVDPYLDQAHLTLNPT